MKKSLQIFSLIAVSILLLSSTIDLNNLLNYADQDIPDYITKDLTPVDNPITDAGATLGRVLFYDKKLSADNTISCGSIGGVRLSGKLDENWRLGVLSIQNKSILHHNTVSL